MPGYHDYAPGEIPGAAVFDDYIGKQVVMLYASAAARDADTDLTAALREGMMCYLIDANQLAIYTGSGWSTIGPVHGGGMAWTPTITQSTTVSKTTVVGRYFRMGRMIFAECLLSCTSSGTANNLLTLSLPVAAESWSNNQTVGVGRVVDASNTSLGGFDMHVCLAGSTTLKFRVKDASATGPATPQFWGNSSVNSDHQVALASGDSISCSIMYAAAADA